MSKSFKYVKDFEFPSHAGYSGSAGQTMVKGYARGGKVVEKATGEVYPSRKAMAKHEMMETPRMQKEEIVQRATVKGMKAGGPGMLPNRGKLGVVGNKNPGETKMHTAPNLPGPKMAMKSGGPVIPKAGYKKIDKVMGEYKRGTLHSGSKTGPEVTNPKQAVAIALSEARRADKKKK